MREVLVDAESIGRRVRELGARISKDYEGKEIVAVGILKGAVIFLSDLARSLDCRVKFDFMGVSSYGTSTRTSGVVRITKDLDESVEGRHVLIVEDIVDTGLTLNYLKEVLKARNPASLRVCSLLDKPSRRKVPVTIDYVGFEIPDAFVVGYGLDFNGLYRHFPFICVLKDEAYRSNGGNSNAR
ncbi:MAG: hypoxanthine phosphoribosyltransferase [Firmicutes bacterium]|nr:hypoxanthine phosphoribosyltransferase [Bacillota bacterium]